MTIPRVQTPSWDHTHPLLSFLISLFFFTSTCLSAAHSLLICCPLGLAQPWTRRWRPSRKGVCSGSSPSSMLGQCCFPLLSGFALPVSRHPHAWSPEGALWGMKNLSMGTCPFLRGEPPTFKHVSGDLSSTLSPHQLKPLTSRIRLSQGVCWTQPPVRASTWFMANLASRSRRTPRVWFAPKSVVCPFVASLLSSFDVGDNCREVSAT